MYTQLGAIVALGLLIAPGCALAQNYFESAPGPPAETTAPPAPRHPVARPRSSSAGSAPAPAPETVVPPPQAAYRPLPVPAWLSQRGVPYADEAADFGVAPRQALHQGPPHAPTPLSVPGATTITTTQLYAALQQRQPMLLLYVNEGGGAIAGSHWLYGAGEGTGFNDVLQARLAQKLTALTQGDKDAALVVYCYDSHCWLSYNVALRLVRLGYRNVYWYRGGKEAWNAAGFPLAAVPQEAW